MSATTRQSLRVTFDDGTEVEVVTDQRDMRRHEIERTRRGLPKIDDGGAVTYLAFMAWSAGARADVLPVNAKTWDEFHARAVEVTTAGEVPVDPTGPVPGSG